MRRGTAGRGPGRTGSRPRRASSPDPDERPITFELRRQRSAWDGFCKGEGWLRKASRSARFRRYSRRRQADRERRTLTDGALRFEPPIHGLDQTLARREPEPPATAGAGLALNLEELVEDSREILRRDARSGVADPDLYTPIEQGGRCHAHLSGA